MSRRDWKLSHSVSRCSQASVGLDAGYLSERNRGGDLGKEVGLLTRTLAIHSANQSLYHTSFTEKHFTAYSNEHTMLVKYDADFYEYINLSNVHSLRNTLPRGARLTWKGSPHNNHPAMTIRVLKLAVTLFDNHVHVNIVEPLTGNKTPISIAPAFEHYVPRQISDILPCSRDRIVGLRFRSVISFIFEWLYEHSHCCTQKSRRRASS